MTKPSVAKLVLYLWLTTILLLALFSLTKNLLGTSHMLGGEILWLFLAPGLVGWIYRKRYKEDVPEETAKNVSRYFVASLLVLSLVGVSVYISQHWTSRLSEHATILFLSVAIYFAVLWFLGRLIVSLGLTNFGRSSNKQSGTDHE